MVAAAMAEALKNKWQMAIVVADEHGTPIVLERMDGVQLGSVGIAEGKAKTSALLRRPTKALEDAVTGNPGATPPAPPRNVVLALSPGITPVGGGLPQRRSDHGRHRLQRRHRGPGRAGVQGGRGRHGEVAASGRTSFRGASPYGSEAPRRKKHHRPCVCAPFALRSSSP
jgi:uncharacterized protein GlcG (DUF336 family)